MHRPTIAFALLLLVAAAHADPLEDDRFTLSVGGFRSRFDTDIRVDSLELGQGTRFSLEDDVGLPREDTLARWEAALRIGERHRVSATWFDAVRERSTRIQRPISFGDIDYDVDLALRGEFEAEVTELLYHFAFLSTERVRAEVLFGIHQLELTARLRAKLNELEEERGVAQAKGPLPVLGAALYWDLSDRWRFDLRAQALDAHVGDFDGRITDLRAGVNFEVTKHIDVGLYYNRFDLRLDIDKERWTGELDFGYHGPQIDLGVSW